MRPDRSGRDRGSRDADAGRRQGSDPTNHIDPTNAIHRKCDACEEEDDMEVQRKALPSSAGLPANSPEHVRGVVGSGGRLLEMETRRFFEPRLGYDLSSIRIHTGAAAQASAKEMISSRMPHGRRHQATRTRGSAIKQEKNSSKNYRLNIKI